MLFPKLMLVAKLPFETSWEKEVRRDLLNAATEFHECNFITNCTNGSEYLSLSVGRSP